MFSRQLKLLSIKFTLPHLIGPHQQTNFLPFQPLHGINQSASPAPRGPQLVEEWDLVMSPIRPAENSNFIDRDGKE